MCFVTKFEISTEYEEKRTFCCLVSLKSCLITHNAPSSVNPSIPSVLWLENSWLFYRSVAESVPSLYKVKEERAWEQG